MIRRWEVVETGMFVYAESESKARIHASILCVSVAHAAAVCTALRSLDMQYGVEGYEHAPDPAQTCLPL